MEVYGILARSVISEANFKWIFLFELLVSSILTIWFLFFFNRLFASLVTYAICTYAWHKFRVHLEIQALQFSLLGGRVFFKGLRYHGHNETILVYDGYITWRYWLRRVRPLQYKRPPAGSAASFHGTDGNGGQERGGEEEEEGEELSRKPGNKSAPVLPCRIAAKVRGIEWFIYNRSSAYDTIMSRIKELEVANSMKLSEKAATTNFGPKNCGRPSDVGIDSVSLDEKEAEKNSPTEQRKGRLDSASSPVYSDSFSESLPVRARSEYTTGIPKIVSLFPIKVECTKGAIVMGNENTRSTLVAKFESTTGYVDARSAQPADSYKQSIDIDFIYPVVQLKINKGFRENQIVEGAAFKAKEEELPVSIKRRYLRFNFKARFNNTWKFLRILNPFSRESAGSLAQEYERPYKAYRHSERNVGVPGQSRWLGLTRYLDGDDDIIEQERWKAIEYGQFPTIINSPKVSMGIHWDVPGLVLSPDSNSGSFYPNPTKDINGDRPPDWGIDIRIFGGNIRYGPWADRQRADLQAVFFPSLHTDIVPAAKLRPGEPRVSTVFKLVIDIEEQTTIGVPTREASKDWIWKGRENTRTQAELKQKNKKPRNKSKKEKKSNEASEVRPFGWFDIKLFADSTISFAMDLVAGAKGYVNQIDLDIRGPEISTSVNHDLVWRSESQKISCNLSYPLWWNELHPWSINISCESPEIFLLRDHVFLLTDLVDDWTSGPTGDFYNFVPYKYAINLDLRNFQIYINSNEANIINHPSDINDNVFIIVHGKIVTASVNIPLTVFHPTRNQIKFDVDARSGGVKLRTPLWNTYHTFLDNSDVASFHDLRIQGSYDYFSTISSGLTDVLTLDLCAGGLRFYLHGFLIRYLIMIKDNYFGDDLHFRTLEEHQAQIVQERQSAEIANIANLHNRLSNDLDVILSIDVEQPCVLLPVHVYSSAENITMDLSSIMIDLRFTNYYMDLSVTFSPVAISHICHPENEDEFVNHTLSTEIFVDGLEIYGHRLFGLPPSEPTYVCSWDFSLGNVTGECSAEFLTFLFVSLRSFIFTFKDAENALACTRSQVIHDITFLRACVQPIRVWLRLDEMAFLVTLKESQIQYNDLATQDSSENFSITNPELILALVDFGSASIENGSQHYSSITDGYLKIAVDIRMAKQGFNFQKSRQLQWGHISYQDLRTNRIPWLIEKFGHQAGTVLSDYRPKIRAPAMPFPVMPGPLLKASSPRPDHSSTSTNDDRMYRNEKIIKRKASFLTTNSTRQQVARNAHNKKSLRIRSKRATNDGKKCYASLQDSNLTQTKNRQARLDFASSSPYKKPHFPLFSIQLDFGDVPMLSNNKQSDTSFDNISPSKFIKSKPVDHETEQSIFTIGFKHGIGAFFQSRALQNLNKLLASLQISNLSTLMDMLQIDLLTEGSQNLETQKGHRRIFELRFLIPHTQVRFSQLSMDSSEFGLQPYQCDFALDHLDIVARSNKMPPRNTGSKTQSHSSLVLVLGQWSCALRNNVGEADHGLAAVRMTMDGVLIKTLTGISSELELRFKNFDIAIAGEQIDSTAALLQNTLIRSQELLDEFSVIKAETISRIRFLVLFLSRNGDNISDPPFLTGTSHYLRSATSHLRTLDTWKLISRLRYIHQKLPKSLRDQMYEQCTREESETPTNASAHVIASFDHWHALDVAHVGENRLIRKVYGPLPNVPDENSKRFAPFQMAFELGKFRIHLAPGPYVNEIAFEHIVVNMTTNLPDLGDSRTDPVGKPSIKKTVIEGRCFKTTFQINWSLVRCVEIIYRQVKIPLKQAPTKTDSSKRERSLTTDRRLHIIASLGIMVLSLGTTKLELVSISRDLEASLILDTMISARTYPANAVINARSVTVIMQKQTAPIALLDLQELTFLGNQNVGIESTNMWNLALLCNELSFKILEEPAALFETIKALIQDESLNFTVLRRNMESGSNPPKSLVMQSDRDTIRYISMSLSITQYVISFALIPSLTYLMYGKGLSGTLVPGEHGLSEIFIDFDLNEHSHVLTKQAANLSDTISRLDIPSINGRYKLNDGSTQRFIGFHIAVQTIALDALAVHALLNTLNRTEIKSLTTDVVLNVAQIQKQLRQVCYGNSKLQDPPALRKVTKYDGHVVLGGFVVHASAQEPSAIVEPAQFQFKIGCIKLNISPDAQEILEKLDLELKTKSIKAELTRLEKSELHQYGFVSFELFFKRKMTLNDQKEIVCAYHVQCNNLNVEIYADTASIALKILGYLQNTLKTIDMPKEVKNLRRLTRSRLRSEAAPPSYLETDAQSYSERISPPLHNDMYGLTMINIHITWKIGSSIPLTAGREAEDLLLSFTKIDLATKKNNAARLLIEGFQLQMSPKSKPLQARSPNSALLSEVIFNVDYLSTSTDRRLAFRAAGKPLELSLTSQFILPASDLRRSIAMAVEDIRKATAAWNSSTNQESIPEKSLLGKKKLVSLLVDANFAGAVVHVKGRTISDPRTRALTVLRGRRLPQQDHSGQFIPENANSNTTLKAPGIALKVEYKDMGDGGPSLNAEFKVNASSNTIYPTVIPLIIEISSSIKEVVGESNHCAKKSDPISSLPKFLDDERLCKADPTSIFGKCKLNLGLRICRQEFSLSCQPITRVATTANIESIYITVNTVQSAENGQFFTFSASFDRLRASVQHVYSRDSTGSFEIESLLLSVMNSKHVNNVNGLSAILQVSPIKLQINARQLHDFLLFREIWAPPDLRQPSSLPELTTTLEPQAFIVQRYQQVAAARAFPWNATVSIAELNVQVELGQALGKPTFVISKIWVSSKKSSDWEQNLCLGFGNVEINSVGRMSGGLELQNLKVRTLIYWPTESHTNSQVPLIQASVSFDQLQVKAAFDFQTFLIADITALEFLMYNIRDSRQARGDRLVGVVDGKKVQIFCTTASAAQGLALYQTFERLVQEKQTAYATSLGEIEKYLHRRSSVNPLAIHTSIKKGEQETAKKKVKAPLQLQTDVVINLKAINVGAFPSTFFDNQIFKLEALDACARFAVILENGKLHSTLGMTLGELRVALSAVSRTNSPQPLSEVSVIDVVANATGSRGGTILKVPKVVATMQTWQSPESSSIEYIFGSSFQGKVDVGWNYSRISFLRDMWTAHARALAQRLGKPLPPSALKITGRLLPEGEDGSRSQTGNQEKITAVVNVPLSRFSYTALQPPVIETPQLRDMGEATPPLEWIGLHRDRLPNLTHQIVIVALLEVAKEVEDAYQRILGTS